MSRPLVVEVEPAPGSGRRENPHLVPPGSGLVGPLRAEFLGLVPGIPHLAKVIYCDSRTGARIALNRIICAWFAACVRHATLVRPHPTLGDVPICADCDAKVHRLSGGARRCQRCSAHPVPVSLVQIPDSWTTVDPAGVRWREWWLCASCAQDALMERAS